MCLHISVNLSCLRPRQVGVQTEIRMRLGRQRPSAGDSRTRVLKKTRFLKKNAANIVLFEIKTFFNF